MRTQRYTIARWLLLILLWSGCVGAPTKGDSASVASVVVDDVPGLPASDAVVRGKNDALVTVHSFVDPASDAYDAVLREFDRLNAANDGELRLVVRAPADLSPAGYDFLVALHAAGGQNKLAAMHELLMKWRSSWKTGGAIALGASMGQEIGLDTEGFRLAVEEGSARSDVEAEVAWAAERGLSGALALNGRLYYDMIEPVPLDAAVGESLANARELLDGDTPRTKLYAAAVAANRDEAPFGQPFRDSTVIPIGESPTFGNAAGTVKIVAFMDFQCPFSKRAAVTMAQLVASNPEVELVFKHNPLPSHKQARDAAAISVAAAAQGQFWEMSEQLFLNQARFSSESIDELAAELGNKLHLDVQRLLRDRDAAYEVVDADIELAHRLDANSTPHFFVNGARIAGAFPLETFQDIVDTQVALARELDVPAVDVYAESVKRSYAPAPRPAAPAEPEIEYAAVPVDAKDPSRGARKGFVVTVVEFADYQCPFCQRVEGTLKKLLDENPDSVRLVFKQRPLPFHASAAPAASAAIAAGEQGKYWEMHEALFADRLPGPDEMDGYTEGLAKKLHLKMSKFKKDRAAAAARIEADTALADRVGARGTPTFFINGRLFVGAQPYDKFVEVLTAETEYARDVQKETGLDGQKLYDEILKRRAGSE